MGCNCKGKKQRLNNLDSYDHLVLASETFLSLVQGKDISQMDEIDKSMIIKTYMSLYPNQKMQPTIEQAIVSLEEAHKKYITKYKK